MPSQWSCRPGCLSVNDGRRRKCEACGKKRPAKRRPKHLAVLDLPYEVFVEANGGRDVCGICGKPPSAARRLDRDHIHEGAGRPRGLLCWAHNKLLDPRWTPEHLEAAAAYLRRANTVDEVS